MIFHNAGKYNGDENSLPKREHPKGAIQFKECANMQTLSFVANGGSILTMALLFIPFILLGKPYIKANAIWLIVALFANILSMIPHEYLHAICYKKDVYLYSDIKNGLLFVLGPEDMSKTRFVFMCLLPNIVFGWIPYIIFLIFPNLSGLGLFGILCTGMGFGDYINVFNALTQMPKGAKTYLSGMHSYWYVP